MKEERMRKVIRTLAPIVAAIGSMVIPAHAQAAPDSAASVPTTFYCAAATAPTVCTPYPPAWETTATRKINIAVTNHASLGERCQLYIDGYGLTSWVYINELDSTQHYLGTVTAYTGFNLRCQRRDSSGDAGIGGYVYQLA
jgi:hypothetical protein